MDPKTSSTRRGALERRLMLLCLALIFGGAVLIVKMPQRISAMEAQKKYDSEFYEFAEIFSDIYSTIRERYVKEVPSKQLFEGAINGMFATLDDHSSYLPPDSAEMLERDTQGEYSGVGLHISLDKDKILTVISPILGSPAAKAGVMPWDRIIEIEGKTTRDITLMEAVKKLTGPTGSSVKIKVWREGETKPLAFELRRENIKVDSVFAKVMDNNIGYMRIAKFQEDTADSVRRELKKFQAAKITGIVVDLRNDAGGLLDKAVEICNMFLPKGQIIVSIKGRSATNNREFYAVEEPLCTVPLAVLVNEGSASASEIFAGAMKDTKRGVIVGPEGKHTYGKGSVQTISVINKSLEKDANGNMRPSGIRLTTALYYTPSGISIHEKGIKPDLGVKLPEGHELMLLRHGLLGDPDMVEPGTNPEDVKKLTTPEDERKQMEQQGDKDQKPGDKNTPPKSMILKQDGPATSTAKTNTQATSESEDADSSLTLEEKLAHRQIKHNGVTVPADFHDLMLDEAIKYLKTAMVATNHQSA